MRRKPQWVSRRSAQIVCTRGRRLEEWRSSASVSLAEQDPVYRMQLSFSLKPSAILRRAFCCLSVLSFLPSRFQVSYFKKEDQREERKELKTERSIVDTIINGGYTGAQWGKVVNNPKTLFIGQYEHGLDDKNRLFIPSRFREKTKGPDYILTQGQERCLFLFPIHYWQDLALKLDALPLANKSEERAFKRILLSAACEAEVDSQGRILVPQHLKEYAGITRHVVVLGVLRHVEIWSKELWNTYSKTARKTFEKVAPHLAL